MPTYAKALKPSRSRGARRMSGAAAVEFALVFPLLLLVVLGAIEFGVALYDKAMLTNASREAARAGAMLKTPPMTTSDIRGVALNYSQGKLVTFGANTSPTVAVANPDGNTNTGSRLQVTVSYTFNGLLLGPLIALVTRSPAPSEFMTNALTINATTVMKYE